MSNSESVTATLKDGGDSSFQEEQVTGIADKVSAPVLRLHDVSLVSKPKTFPTCGGRLGHSRPLPCKTNEKINKLACWVFRPFLNHAFISGNKSALFLCFDFKRLLTLVLVPAAGVEKKGCSPLKL